MKKLVLLGTLCLFAQSLWAQDEPGNVFFAIDTVYFEFDRYDITPKYLPELDSLVGKFGSYASYYVEIFGHTDSIGSDAYNLELSELRARAVALYLVEQGIDLDRIFYEGLGTTKPVASNETFSGRRENRRADIAVVFSNEVFIPPTQRDTTPVEEAPIVEVDPATLTDTIYCDYSAFQFNPRRRTVIITPMKSEILVSPNSFQTDADEITFEVDELFLRSEMITNNMTTISKDGPLESVGVLAFSATDRGRAVKLQDGVSFELKIPATRRDAEATAYKGSGGNRGGTRRRGRRGRRGAQVDEGTTPVINAVNLWNEMNTEVLYKGRDKAYVFKVDEPARYTVGRMLYYSQNTPRNDDGIDILVKLKGKRFERNTTAMIVGEVVKTYIPLKKRSTRNYEALKTRFIDPKTEMIMVAIQYDDKGNPWIVKRPFKTSAAKKPRGRKKNKRPVVKIKAKFRKVTPERMKELLTELNV